MKLNKDEAIHKTLSQQSKNNKGKGNRESIDPKGLLITFILLVLLVGGLIFSMWLSHTPTPPESLLSEVNEQEIDNAVRIVESISRSEQARNEIVGKVNGMLNRILMYDNGKTDESNGYITYNLPDKPHMGMLQRASMAASEEKLRVIYSMKTPDETFESKIITSSNNPIEKIFVPAWNKQVAKAVLNIYMNNGDPPVSLALSNELLILLAVIDFSNYFQAYVGTEKKESVWLDDEYLQQFVNDLVPVFYDMMAYPYTASGKEVPKDIKESVALKLCESWNGITPLTKVDKCSTEVQGTSSNERSRQGS